MRERRSVTVTCPSHPVDSLLEQLGGALPVTDEGVFNIFSALTGTLTAHYTYPATLTSWATGHDIAPTPPTGMCAIIPTGKRKGQNPSVARIHRALAEHAKREAWAETARFTGDAAVRRRARSGDSCRNAPAPSLL
ncbi:hypothetical protein [Nonomuraea sp. NPDC049646]|uniref:hypothetical protein n=1 Tax=unclassified Nonomuraea TaxID=2593643 RepID=UPI0037BB5EAA